VTAETQAEPGAPGEPEIEWRTVASWPVKARNIMEDIEAILRVTDLMTGAADDAACQVFTDFLAAALLARRRELALMILDYHAIEPPDQGDVQTPQQRMSEGLKHIADEVRKNRPDIVPDQQPFTGRARREQHRT
jgi:hypothetical protein